MRKVPAFVFCLLLLCSGQCFGSRDILVFFDVSGSTKKEVINEYFQEYRNVVKGLKEGDSIACAFINSNTRGSFSPVGSINIRPKESLESPTGYKEEVDKNKNRGMLELKRKLEATKPSGDTDILSSLAQAQDYFRTSGNSGQKVLVIFSDMIEETKTLNIKNLTKGQVNSAVNRVKGNIPQLAGVKIYAVGATGSGPESYQAIEEFWKQIFVASGGNCALFSKSLYSFE